MHPEAVLCDDRLDAEAADRFVLRDAERARRADVGEVPAHVRKLADDSAKYFEGNPLGEFVYLRTYSRWIESASKREDWPDTVNRYIDFIVKHYGEKIPSKVIRKIKDYLMEFSVMPSMRFLWAAGIVAIRFSAHTAPSA